MRDKRTFLVILRPLIALNRDTCACSDGLGMLTFVDIGTPTKSMRSL